MAESTELLGGRRGSEMSVGRVARAVRPRGRSLSCDVHNPVEDGVVRVLNKLRPRRIQLANVGSDRIKSETIEVIITRRCATVVTIARPAQRRPDRRSS